MHSDDVHAQTCEFTEQPVALLQQFCGFLHIGGEYKSAAAFDVACRAMQRARRMGGRGVGSFFGAKACEMEFCANLAITVEYIIEGTRAMLWLARVGGGPSPPPSYAALPHNGQRAAGAGNTAPDTQEMVAGSHRPGQCSAPCSLPHTTSHACTVVCTHTHSHSHPIHTCKRTHTEIFPTFQVKHACNEAARAYTVRYIEGQVVPRSCIASLPSLCRASFISPLPPLISKIRDLTD